MDDHAHAAGPPPAPVVVPGPARPRLRPPFDTWSAEALVEHFATRTDALTKSVFVMGAEDGIRFIDTLGDVDAIAVTPEGKVIYSKGLAPP